MSTCIERIKAGVNFTTRIEEINSIPIPRRDFGPVHTYRDILDSKISPSTRCQIRCGIFTFHSEERIHKYPDSPNACGRKPYPERRSCGL